MLTRADNKLKVFFADLLARRAVELEELRAAGVWLLLAEPEGETLLVPAVASSEEGVLEELSLLSEGVGEAIDTPGADTVEVDAGLADFCVFEGLLLPETDNPDGLLVSEVLIEYEVPELKVPSCVTLAVPEGTAEVSDALIEASLLEDGSCVLVKLLELVSDEEPEGVSAPVVVVEQGTVVTNVSVSVVNDEIVLPLSVITTAEVLTEVIVIVLSVWYLETCVPGIEEAGFEPLLEVPDPLLVVVIVLVVGV